MSLIHESDIITSSGNIDRPPSTMLSKTNMFCIFMSMESRLAVGRIGYMFSLGLSLHGAEGNVLMGSSRCLDRSVD